MPATIVSISSETAPPCSSHPRPDRVGGALAQPATVDVDAAHPRLGGERDEVGPVEIAAPKAVPLLREHDDRTALGGLVGEAGDLRGVRERLDGDAGGREELGGLPVPEGDRAGLVEQQRVDVAGGLDGAPRHRQHVALHESVHPGDADRRQQRADRGGDQAHEQGDQHDHGLLGARVDRHRLQRDRRQQEHDREAREQDVEGDLVRGLLALRALHERDHPVDERLAGLRRDLDHDPIREHLGAAGHGAAVAARLADDREPTRR